MKLAVQPEKVRGKLPAPKRGWPHPGRPGWPHYYDRPGYFCLEDLESGTRYVMLWDPARESWDVGANHWFAPGIVAKYRYLGICYPTYRDAPDPLAKREHFHRPRRW